MEKRYGQGKENILPLHASPILRPLQDKHLPVSRSHNEPSQPLGHVLLQFTPYIPFSHSENVDKNFSYH